MDSTRYLQALKEEQEKGQTRGGGGEGAALVGLGVARHEFAEGGYNRERVPGR